jgi:hypothetical protein
MGNMRSMTIPLLTLTHMDTGVWFCDPEKYWYQAVFGKGSR